MKNILFRADSSSKIGTGHIMRDLVLAGQFEDANIVFAVQDLPGNINHKIHEKNYDIEVLQSNDIEELLDVINKYSIDMIIIDHYEIDCDYEKALKEKTNTILFVFDDTYEEHFCDILLNHNVSGLASKYKGLIPDYCVVKCGVKYTLLRDEFRTIQKKERDIKSKKNLTVFLAMGGADHLNKNIDILRVINKIGNINTNVVTTNANEHLNELKEYVKEYKNITLHLNTDNIAQLMNKSDFAIVTPSVVVNEVLYMELPFIAIQTAENQYEIAQYLQDRNFLVLPSYDERALMQAIKTITDVKIYNEILDNIKLVLEGGIDR